MRCCSALKSLMSIAGVSHQPDRYASPERISGGVDVLARRLARLAE